MLLPQFLPGPSGRLFTNLYLPQGDQVPTRWVLHIPAFAEEMNKSRHMVQQQGKSLALQGIAVLVPDLYGTGDSEGDFSDADWVCWKRDIKYLISWAKERGAEEIVLWGLRLGCLLAADVADSTPESINQLLLWQPVVSGQQAMTQFLRLRMAAGLLGGEGESVADLREQLNSGMTLEIAGYDISPDLFAQISRLTLNDLKLDSSIKIDWYEVVQSDGKSLNMQAKKIIQSWSEGGLEVNAETVLGEPFWTTQELSTAPDLIASTTVGFSVKESNTEISVIEGSAWLYEQPLVLSCCDERLLGILHKPASSRKRAVLVIVGGPQYRVGSHRQFVLLARDLAANGTPVFRFDYRGMGDSDGTYGGFDVIQDDIRSAIDALTQNVPEVEEIVLWGLCDAASAASFYAASDQRVTGLVLLNPWVRSEAGEAKAYLKHYYLQRFLSKAFWKKVFKGEFRITSSLKSLNTTLKDAVVPIQSSESNLVLTARQNLFTRMEVGLKEFKGQSLLILSENDLTAAEFRDAAKGSKIFKNLLTQPRLKWIEIADADHTFSRRMWRNQVADLTAKWLNEW